MPTTVSFAQFTNPQPKANPKVKGKQEAKPLTKIGQNRGFYHVVKRDDHHAMKNSAMEKLVWWLQFQ
jgi:hypothetical protein